ncbi:MAG: ABC transporter ATP-binding protein [Pseudomonadota bacterium]
MLTVDNISLSFGGIRAVNACSFQVAEGSITGLIGPNGAGKSTIFNVIAGALKPDKGAVHLSGRNITGRATHTLFHDGLVRTFQIPHEFSRMTVRENLMIVPPGQTGERLASNWFAWGKIRREEKEIGDKVDDVLSFLNISHVADELAGNLSGGQKKLLDLGRTMMTDARLVLLDEPGAGVNRTLLGDIVEAIRKLNEERGYTFCLIEHDMEVISKLCHPVIVMAQGTVLTEGPMDDVRADPRVREVYLGHTDIEEGAAQ